MEFWIVFGVTFIIYGLYKAGKRAGEKELRREHIALAKPASDHEQKLKQADEELITVILPTINNKH